ncbi:unnamed protein product [Bursaphelenchus okinawaensis]|uniref:Uncharacterized protein n=1 Tax=Bursaphelenchus okinawaensis TaxID=465554 RepID=A0A811LPK5_9BILA|nr:unnamed protein product [Bursaphelenchus okinawaensis]CAG9126470.1 unnamed protein product [Bursaphelenchus okinawaensis]
MLSRYLCHLCVLLSIVMAVISVSVEEPEEYMFIANPYPSWPLQDQGEAPHRMKKWASSLRFGKRGPGWASQVRFG